MFTINLQIMKVDCYKRAFISAHQLTVHLAAKIADFIGFIAADFIAPPNTLLGGGNGS